MDDTKDDRYSRAPEIEDLVSLCRSLNEAGAKYLLIGGFAVILQGYVRGTKDIDLLVDPSPENVKKLKKALSSLPDNAISLISDSEVEEYQVVRISDEIVIDLMASACGVSLKEINEGIEWKEIQGVKIPVAGKKLLIRLKKTLRPSDMADISFLNQLLDAEEKKK